MYVLSPLQFSNQTVRGTCDQKENDCKFDGNSRPKWEMRVEVGRGAFAIVELLRHPTSDIAMIMKTVSKNKYDMLVKNHKLR